MSKTFKNILLTISCACLVLMLFLVFSASRDQKSDFKRNVLKNLIKGSHVYPNEDFGQIAGAGKSHIYLATKDPNVLKIINLESNSIESNALNFSINSKIRSLFWTFVDSPLVRIMAGNARYMLSGSLNNQYRMQDSVYEFNFSLVIPVSNSSFIFRGPNGHSNDQYLKKYESYEKKALYENNLIEKRGDGGISTDGTFAYDSQTKLFIYSQFYRNTILCFDSNLNKISEFNSIDTCRHYQIEGLRQLDAHGSLFFTVKSVPNYVNLASDASDGKLYLHSKQWAENESRSDHTQNSVIDVYDLKIQNYLYSFYIPDYNGEHMQTFKIISKGVIVLYSDAAVLYVLNY